MHFQPRARKRESRALGIWRQWEPSAGTCDHIKSVIVDRARERSRAEARLGILQDSIYKSRRGPDFSGDKCIASGLWRLCTAQSVGDGRAVDRRQIEQA